MNNSHTDNINQSDARQGQRIKGMPSVLAISTIGTAILFAIVLAISLT
jgi:hypothetical protein